MLLLLGEGYNGFMAEKWYKSSTERKAFLKKFCKQKQYPSLEFICILRKMAGLTA